MSLLDTRHPDLDDFLQRWRRRLNTRFFAGEGLAAWSAAVPAAAAAAFVFQPQAGPRLVLGAVLAASATLAFVLWRRRRRLSRHEAASWLDERGQTQGLFRAASECLDLPAPGRGPEQVLAEADRRRAGFQGASSPRLPWRRLALRTLAAFGLTAAAAGVLSLVPPVPGFPGHPGPPDSAQAPVLDPEVPGGASQELNPHEAAQRLFPEDTRLAALAEQALASGDPGALESLLEQNAAQAGRGASPQGAPAPGGKPGQDPGDAASQDGAPSTQEGPADPGKKGTPGSSAGPRDRQPPGSDSGASAGGKSPGTSGRSPGGEDTPSGNPSTQAPGGNRPGQNGTGGPAEFPSGGAPGTGQSQQPLGAAPGPGTSDRRLVLKDQENQGVFEYVLPGSGPQLPAAQTLADSRRSAEAVISRTSPPLEFENTIREYFLSLTTLTQAQEASP